jgi:hypothetical protein
VAAREIDLDQESSVERLQAHEAHREQDVAGAEREGPHPGSDPPRPVENRDGLGHSGVPIDPEDGFEPVTRENQRRRGGGDPRAQGTGCTEIEAPTRVACPVARLIVCSALIGWAHPYNWPSGVNVMSGMVLPPGTPYAPIMVPSPVVLSIRRRLDAALGSSLEVDP